MLTAITGINWGDEGKGRMVDLISQEYDIVARYQGGNNAGHTVKNERGKFVLNLLPSGILRPNVVCVMGNGMVIDPHHLDGEINKLREQGVEISPANLKISDRATITMPYHVEQDGLEEARLSKTGAQFGSTKRGIAYAYGDKYMKKTLRMGDLLHLDDAVKKAAAARIARGKTEIYVSVETDEGGDLSVTVNHALAERYLAALRELSEKYGLRDDVTVMSLAKLPDVLGSERIEQDADELTQDVLTVFAEACDGFDQMREREGEKLAEDVRNRASVIETLVGEVEKRSPERVAEYREKLLARMREVLESTDIDETRIVTEAAIYADKTAVDEETVRLRSHLHQLDGMLNEVKPVGRKLDFLVQEMNREANTIGSKANDVEMAQTVVNIKSEIEKIREQIQNIE